MGRPKRAEPYRLRQRKGRPWEVLFRLDDGTEHDIGLSTYDSEQARALAFDTYCKAKRGELMPKRGKAEQPKRAIGSAKTTTEVGGQWLTEMVGTLRARTRATYEIYIAALSEEMETVADWSSRAFERLLSKRLATVLADTARKEFAVYRQLVAYGQKLGYAPAGIVVPSVPAKAKGTRYSQPRRQAAEEFSPEEIERLIAALPEWSRRSRKDGSRYPIRARFLIGYELTLRPELLNLARIGLNWASGRDTWWVPREHDKIGNERMLPMSERCVAALESLGITEGLIFGEHDYRCSLRAAARKVFPSKAERFIGQHLRSAGGTHLCEFSGNPVAVQYIMGHKRLSTTSRYMRPSQRAAAEAMAAATAKRAAIR